MKDQDLLQPGHVFCGYTFEHQSIALDGNEFEDCCFIACQISYAGIGPFLVSGSRFEDCSFNVGQPALSGLEFLAFISKIGNGGAGLVEEFVNLIKQGVVPFESRRPPHVTLQ